MFHFITNLIHQNAAIMAMMGMGLIGSLAIAFKEVPRQLSRMIKGLFCVTLTVPSNDQMFDYVSTWLARHEKASRSSELMLTKRFDYDKDAWAWEFTLGEGLHFIFQDRRLVIVKREIEKGSATSYGAKIETIKLTTLGRKQESLRSIIGMAQATFNDDGRIRVFYWRNGGYCLSDRRAPRSLDTVYMPPEQKARILADVYKFLASKEFYRERGIPWRRSYLLEGGPGTGKTTLIFAIASELGVPVYLINLSNIAGDNELLAAFNDAPTHAFVVIEDIDTNKVTADRTLNGGKQPEAHAVAVPGQTTPAPGITLSGLLNGIDGVVAREGRMLWITTNFAEHLDKALLRPGRADRREKIEALHEAEAWTMWQRFRPHSPREEFNRALKDSFPITAAEMQEMLLRYEEEWSEVVEMGEAA